MDQSESIVELAKAMCEVQKTELFAIADSKSHYSNYADLSSVWIAARKPLTENGLSVVQTNEPCNDGVIVVTTLLHTSGEWIRGRLQMKADKQGPQGFGSAMTYGRRYALMAMVGICPADDDAEAATSRARDTAPLSANTHKKFLYTLPNPPGQAMKDAKEYKPDIVIMNKEETKFKIGKYDVETNDNGSMIWTNAPKFGTQGFAIGDCVPCLLAHMCKLHSPSFVEGNFGIKVTRDIK